ncbi:M24 family metallopeptidase [Fundidesulfovibrio terrae]|uniref:M24 family metallopeptidase n=1 Tax=Fundidesulfovibrio terrae TaxID=2922866 RepID=UPI001FAF21EF|nr:M24 family metallopeptidase [Fundidesulfovibrio terrae]
MFEAIEVMPAGELVRRHAACRSLLARFAPDAGGLAVFSRLAIYYLTGTFGNGVLWLPVEGEPVLMVRKGMERARMESPLSRVVPFRSYSDIPGLCREAGSPLTEVAAAEMNGLSWSLSGLLTSKLKDVRFVPGDMVLARAQAVKSPWELNKTRLCGARHAKALTELLPGRIRPGMSEREVSHSVWEVFFELGHPGMLRMGAHGEEIFLGHVAAGDSGNYPSVFNGPLGLRGEHPAIPFMGYAGQVWRKGQPLSVDCGFALEGYNTDKTQVYWAGPRSSVPDEVASAHAFCMDVQAWTAERLKPEVSPAEIWAHCSDWAVREGFDAGFMGLGGNKVPFLGHGIGLVIDAWPVLAKGFDEPFEEGMVMAVEPKMGIAGVGMVGVENTFEVTASGGVCLTGGGSFDMIAVE